MTYIMLYKITHTTLGQKGTVTNLGGYHPHEGGTGGVQSHRVIRILRQVAIIATGYPVAVATTYFV